MGEHSPLAHATIPDPFSLTRCTDNKAEHSSSTGSDRDAASPVVEKMDHEKMEKMDHTPPGDSHPPYLDPSLMEEDYDGKPTEEEMKTLRRVPGSIPMVAYLICIVEFCERASYYGVQPLLTNYVNRPLPDGGNGYGAPPRTAGDQQTAGALGMGTVAANAVGNSFSLLAYSLPLLFGWLADAKTGRFKLICWGVLVFGVAHVVLVAAGSKDLLASGNAKVPFFLSVYGLSFGAGKLPSRPRPLLPQANTSSQRHVQAQRLAVAPRPGHHHRA